jgi:hypothetical protein
VEVGGGVVEKVLKEVGLMRLMSFVYATLLLAASLLKADEASKDVLAQMREGGISLRFWTAKIGPKQSDVLLHLYVVPKGKLGGAKGPVTRDDLNSGIEPSPFFLDLFMREQGQLKRLNSAQFLENMNAGDVKTLWLEPKQRRGPIIAMRFGVCDVGAWTLIIFPKGLSEEPIVQVFEYSVVHDDPIQFFPCFDRVDKRGFLMVCEEWSEGKKSGTRYHRWNGVEFKDRSRPYFVIAGSFKTRKAAEEFMRTRKLRYGVEIRSSGHYPKLTPGYYVVIQGRFESQKEAAKAAADCQKNGTPY